jgi:hypothetical protein
MIGETKPDASEQQAHKQPGGNFTRFDNARYAAAGNTPKMVR